MRKRVKRRWPAKNDRSKAPRLAKSGGLGNTPCVKAKVRMKTPIVASKIISTKVAAATAE